MPLDFFEPKINANHKFAVAVYTGCRKLVILQTYPSLEQLEAGYKDWYKYASKRGVTKPYPVEILDPSLKCRVLKNMISPSNN